MLQGTPALGLRPGPGDLWFYLGFGLKVKFAENRASPFSSNFMGAFSERILRSVFRDPAPQRLFAWRQLRRAEGLRCGRESCWLHRFVSGGQILRHEFDWPSPPAEFDLERLWSAMSFPSCAAPREAGALKVTEGVEETAQFMIGLRGELVTSYGRRRLQHRLSPRAVFSYWLRSAQRLRRFACFGRGPKAGPRPKGHPISLIRDRHTPTRLLLRRATTIPECVSAVAAVWAFRFRKQPRTRTDH